jgi:hypothetical protein
MVLGIIDFIYKWIFPIYEILELTLDITATTR